MGNCPFFSETNSVRPRQSQAQLHDGSAFAGPFPVL